jgi:hypothetical protein
MTAFRGVVHSPGAPGEAAHLHVPAEVIGALGGKQRPAVRVTLNGYTYRTTVAVYGGQHLIGVRREIQKASRVPLDQEVDVTIELDDQPRTVQVPEDLQRAFEAEPNLRAAFERQAYTRRKEQVDGLLSAKRSQTRERRLSDLLSRLSRGTNVARVRE